ncbi:hypothetical protein [Marinobacter salexigens]|uniref:hypothetical protein n=1 Tax=Marinobacter salexigens TaxID=1925763 RepID=UPI0012900143|nr:hypothetical protein [Marinobacter salexigens]
MTEIIAIFVGWLLGVLSTLLLEFRADARRESELLSRAYAVGEQVFIDSDILAALHNEGVKRSISELFEENAEAASIPIASPPSLPSDSHNVAEEVFRCIHLENRNELARSLRSLIDFQKTAEALYSEISVRSERGDEIPSSVIDLYNLQRNKIRESAENVLRKASGAESNYLCRKLKSLTKGCSRREKTRG